MNITFTKQEKEAIKNLSKKQDLTEKQIIRQALRTYQLVVEEYYTLSPNILRDIKFEFQKAELSL